MPGLLNWPPSRGPNPHTHGREYVPGNIIRKELPAPPKREASESEKAEIAELMSHAELSIPDLKDIAKVRVKAHKRKALKRPLLAGEFRTWYQVSDVASLTLEQAITFVRVCGKGGIHRKTRDWDHLDDWCWYKPRTLWVDLTYPLSRGVRLTVQPLIDRRLPCKACPSDGFRKDIREELCMPVGYFLWVVAKEYERIYKEHEKFGVWGHAIEDLGFEIITVGKNGVVDLFIGS